VTDEEPVLLPTEKGLTAVWKAVSLYPSSDPVEYARRKARAVSLSPRTLILVPSVGLGHGLAELLERLPDGCAVLCVEAHQQIMALAMAAGLPRDSRLLVIRSDSEEAAIQALHTMGPGRFRRVIEVPLSAGYRLAPAFYAGVRRLLEAGLREHWRNRLTLIALGSLQVRNAISNIGSLPFAGDFSALSTSLPIIVAAAGPSLDDAIPLIRASRGCVVLLAVDTALPRLCAEGLSPDVVIALEAQAANLEDFLADRGSEVILACDLSCHPLVPRLFPGRTFFFSSEFAPLRIFGRLERAGLLPAVFPALGSVGVAAVHAALRLTTANVYVTGLDFSFSGGRTHARGTPRHLAGLCTAMRTSAVGSDAFQAIHARSPSVSADKNGMPVLTDSVMLSYREGLVRTIQGAGGRVVDLGTTGLDLGARRARSPDLASLARGGSRTGRQISGTDTRPFSRSAVAAFLQAEARILAAGEKLVGEAAKSGEAAAECLEFLREGDYAWVHFPDPPDDTVPGRSFFARAGAAARTYKERLRRAASLL